MEGDDVPPARCNVREATRSDVDAVAALHVAEIHEGFLATLGPRFLRHLYARIVESPHGFLIVAENAPSSEQRPCPCERVRRRCRSQCGNLYREFLWHDGVVASVTSAPQLVRSLPRVVETLRYGSRQPPGAAAAVGAPRPSSSRSPWRATAVGRGSGAALVEAFLARGGFARAAPRRGWSSGASNDAAVALYGRGGFATAENLEVHEGTPSLLMRADLGQTGRR